MKYDMYDPKVQPPGARWSKRLGKWRYPVMRGFHWDRQGIHIALGLLAGYLGLSGVDGAITMLAIVTAGFVVYEWVEAEIIGDDAYIDIGAYVAGLMAAWPFEPLAKVYNTEYLWKLMGVI